MSSASPASKSTHEKQLVRLVRKHKLLRARDLAGEGLPTITLTRLVQAGKLDRVARGLYALPDAAMSEHRSLAEVSLLVPRGVVCLLSALQFREIGTQAPFLPDHYAESFVRTGRMCAVAPETLHYRCRFSCMRRRAPSLPRAAENSRAALVSAHTRSDTTIRS